MDVRQFLPPLGQFLDFCYCRGIGGMDNRLKCEVCFLSNDVGHERRCPLVELSFWYPLSSLSKKFVVYGTFPLENKEV